MESGKISVGEWIPNKETTNSVNIQKNNTRYSLFHDANGICVAGDVYFLKTQFGYYLTKNGSFSANKTDGLGFNEPISSKNLPTNINNGDGVYNVQVDSTRGLFYFNLNGKFLSYQTGDNNSVTLTTCDVRNAQFCGFDIEYVHVGSVDLSEFNGIKISDFDEQTQLMIQLVWQMTGGLFIAVGMGSWILKSDSISLKITSLICHNPKITQFLTNLVDFAKRNNKIQIFGLSGVSVCGFLNEIRKEGKL